METQKTVTVRSWDELIKLVKDMNQYENTLILTGWMSEILENIETGVIECPIRELVFSIKPIEILRENVKKQTKRIPNRCKNKKTV